MNSVNSSVQTNPLIAFLQANKQIFDSSPDLFQRVLKYISTLIPPDPNFSRKILLPQAHGFQLIEEADIVYLEADGSYTYLILKEGKRILVSKPLKEFDNMLNPAFFERIHKSYIINLLHLKSFSRLQGGHVTLADGTELLISRRRIPSFLDKMAQISLSFK